MLENDASYNQKKNCFIYIGIICGHMDLNTPRTFMSLLGGDDEIENIEHSNTSVPTNTHMQYPPRHIPSNYAYPTPYYLNVSTGGSSSSQNAPPYSPTLLPPTST